MMNSILIANRGEIACRIIRTAKAMGIRTIAVYSDADENALHVRSADEAVHIGSSAAAESYLIGENIIAAAKAGKADAIHPGYGFLSENAKFAQSVIDAGLIWVGPKPQSIRAMGLKDAAKKLMDAAGVPTTPGYLGDNQDPEHLAAQAKKIGYPVLIKAVAGGGGKGMRKVSAAENFADDLLSCQREAKASFGNDIVLIEKWIESPRHIEVQVFGDTHGNVVHLFERDCSLQRRHQKVIEEAPAPGMDEETRAAVCSAAVRAAQAVDYEGAGTIEFIADGREGLRADKIWFMEMNTRLQVEHPVTEEITGVDLVEWQLRVAAGEPLPKKQHQLTITGHAVEARLYAEDPLNGFLPSTGPLDLLSFAGEGALIPLRVETGVEQGDEVSPFYDPMIAKLVTHGENREAALNALAGSLEGLRIWPVKSNAGFLLNCCNNTVFREAKMTTGFIEQCADDLRPPSTAPDEAWLAAAKSLAFKEPAKSRSLFDRLSGFRLNAASRSFIMITDQTDMRLVDISADTLMAIFPVDEGRLLFVKGQPFLFSVPRFDGDGEVNAGAGEIFSPMPGQVIAIEVAEGDSVVRGQKLMVLEAMKMEHAITAPFEGIVSEIGPALGDQVPNDALLVRIEADDHESL